MRKRINRLGRLTPRRLYRSSEDPQHSFRDSGNSRQPREPFSREASLTTQKSLAMKADAIKELKKRGLDLAPLADNANDPQRPEFQAMIPRIKEVLAGHAAALETGIRPHRIKATHGQAIGKEEKKKLEQQTYALRLALLSMGVRPEEIVAAERGGHPTTSPNAPEAAKAGPWTRTSKAKPLTGRVERVVPLGSKPKPAPLAKARDEDLRSVMKEVLSKTALKGTSAHQKIAIMLARRELARKGLELSEEEIIKKIKENGGLDALR